MSLGTGCRFIIQHSLPPTLSELVVVLCLPSEPRPRRSKQVSVCHSLDPPSMSLNAACRFSVEYPGKDADILDEAIAFFRANVLFRKFDIHGERNVRRVVGGRTLLEFPLPNRICAEVCKYKCRRRRPASHISDAVC